MKLNLKLTTVDGSQTSVTARPVDFVGWERKTNRKVSDMQESGVGLEDMFILAYSALFHNAPDKPDFDEWMATIDSIEDGEADAPKSTKAAASKGQ